MGLCARGIDTNLKRAVAIKVLRDDVASIPNGSLVSSAKPKSWLR